MTLPNGWEEATLFKYLGLVSSGVKQFQGTKKYIDTGSLETGRIRDGVDVDYATRPSRANMEVKEGDILFAKMKDTEKVYLISKDDVNHLYSTGFAILRIKDKSKLLPKYIYFWLRANDFQRLKNKESTGATQKAINETKLKNFKIAIPPIKTQERIIALLEKAEQIKNWRKEADALSKDYLKSVFAEMFGDPIKNTKKWDLKTLPQFVTRKKNSMKRGPFGGSLKKEIFVDDGYLVYEQRHAIHNDFEFARYYISDEKYKELEMFKVEPGDLIISCSGTLGRIAEIPVGAKKGIINQALLKITLNQEVMNNEFFKFIFRSPNMQSILFGISRGSGIPNFPSMDEVKSVKFIAPPIELQNKFARIANKLNLMNNLQETSKNQADTLFNSFMQKAFKGELV